MKWRLRSYDKGYRALFYGEHGILVVAIPHKREDIGTSTWVTARLLFTAALTYPGHV